MKKRLLVAAVLALTVLALCVAAAPALAEFPDTGVPQTAYVHLWWGAYPEPIVWEEYKTPPADPWRTWAATKPAPSGRTYKAIPVAYDIVFVVWMMGIPRGQMAAMPGDLLLAGTLNDPAGDPLWSITTKEAKPYWGEVIGLDGWTMPTFNKEDAQTWEIAWTYDYGHLTKGTYSGVATYIFEHNAIDHIWWDPTGTMKTPAHLLWEGTYTSPFSFDVE